MMCLAKSFKIAFTHSAAYSLPAFATLCFLLGVNSPATAADFTITTVVNATNGGNVIDGNDSLTITTTGSITVNDLNGVSTSGANNTVINNGTINVSGVLVRHGIELRGNNDIGINNGSINTTGDLQFGFNTAAGTGITAINNGVITTTGNTASGIRVQTNNNSGINTGTIRTSGMAAHGIQLSDNNTSATNSGNIFVTGANSRGIDLFFANGGTLTNSGLISATGNATQAITGGANTQTVNLQTGSQIIGSINLGAGADTFNVLGMPLASSQMTLTDVETITLAAGLPGVVNGNVVTTVDPSLQSIQGPALSTLTSAFHNVISQRLAHTGPLAPVQLASLELAPGMLFQERAPVVWGEVFGSHRSRGNDGLALAYDHDYAGFTGGYERDFHNARVGLFAGFATADAETDIISIQTDTDSFFGGGYAHFYLGPVNLTASVAAGVEDHENDRTVIDNLAGIETARSDFTSVFFSPSLTLGAAYTLNETFEFRPSASLTYYVAWYDSYNESGTTRSNLSIDDRTDQALIGRLQLALAMALTDTTELELRTGVISRHTDQDNVNASLAGASFQYAAAGDDSVYGGLVGGNVRVHVTDRLDVMGDAEIIHASGDESDISARLRVEYRF